VNLKSWNSLVLDAFSRNVTAIISPTAYQKNGEDWINLHPLGTGPFIFAEMERSQYVKYVKNQNYWDKSLPYFDAIQIITVKDPLVKQATLLKGDANGSRELDNTVARAMVDSGKFVAELGAEGNFVINFNSVDPKSMWSNPNMRAALEYALDKETMSNSLGKGFTRASYECLSGIFGAGNNPGTTPRKYDPAKAIQLMKDAGYPNGIKVKMELNQNFNNDWVVAIQGQLAKVGIMIEPDIIPAAAWQERKIQPAAPGVLRYDRARGGPNDMLRTTNEDLATTSAIGFPGVKRPDGWDAILQQALQETDPAKILTLMNQLEQKAYGETMYVPVFKQPNTNVWSPNFKGDLGTICYYAGVDGSSIMKYLYQVK
jgi:ABC-type transport system substrate-binding protein